MNDCNQPRARRVRIEMTINPPASGRQSVNPAQTLQQGMILHQQGKLSDAERLYSAVHASLPGLFDAQYLLGVVRMQQGRTKDALPLLAKAVAQKPDSLQALSALAVTQAGLGRHQDALA